MRFSVVARNMTACDALSHKSVLLNAQMRARWHMHRRKGGKCRLKQPSVAARPVPYSSMGSTGDAYDNPMAESFFATLEREAIDRRRFKSWAEARMEIFTWQEGWYNPHRHHSALGYLPPTNYERKMLSKAA